MKHRTLIAVPGLELTGGVTNYYSALALDEEPNISYFPVTGGEKGWRRYFRLTKIYIRLLARLPFCHTLFVNPSLDRNSFWRDAVIVMMGQIFCSRTIVFWRGWYWPYFRVLEESAFHRFVFRHTFAKADDTIYLAKSFHDSVARLFGETAGRTHLETTVADDRYLAQNADAGDKAAGSVTILFASRMDRAKGIYIVLDVYSRLKAEAPELKLVMAGAGDELDAAKAYAKDNNIDGVSFPGYLREMEKHQAYSNADVFFFPTYYGEGMPNCVLEALCYGVPVVSTYVAGIPDVVSDGVNGFLIDSRDAADFHPAVKRLIDDPQLRSNMGIAARSGSDRFTLKQVRERILKLVESSEE